ncbi:hypothetical protein B0H14DRAFT_3423947 [Mycena olivaceomarginata]|nr:hypothetical protein B0H14DRAFT_3423947 [Mycena olivaceomarginata]
MDVDDPRVSLILEPQEDVDMASLPSDQEKIFVRMGRRKRRFDNQRGLKARGRLKGTTEQATGLQDNVKCSENPPSSPTSVPPLADIITQSDRFQLKSVRAKMLKALKAGSSRRRDHPSGGDSNG